MWETIQKRFQTTDSFVSLILGVAVVLIIGTLTVNFFTRTKQTKQEAQIAAETKVDKYLRNDVSEEEYNGRVFCLTVADNGTFVVRQHGKVWISGNSNPGGVGHEWVRDRFVESGWANGRPFIPARLSDNPYIDQKAYIESLNKLDPVTREQILAGNWAVMPQGPMFQREWFEIIDEPPDRPSRTVRSWDLAATKNLTSAYTSGARMSRKGDDYFIEHIIRMRGTPNEVERVAKQTAEIDGRRVAIRMEEEGGSGGPFTIEALRDY